MWVNPNHPNPPRPATAPVEEGERLLTLPRGQGQELRLTRSEFKGHPFLSLRVWERGQGGAYFPSKSGVSIRLHEVPELAEALATVAGGSNAPSVRSTAPPGRRPRGPRQPDSTRPTPGDGAETRYVDRSRKQRPPWEEAN